SVPPTWMDFDQVLLESAIAGIRPDVVGVSGSDRTIVEVAVTHFVDEDKKALLRQLGDTAIEIVLDPGLNEQWSWRLLEELVVDGTDAKMWLHFPNESQLMRKAEDKAHTLAAEQAVPSSRADGGTRPPRIQFKVEG